jgi:hypothetical protein
VCSGREGVSLNVLAESSLPRKNRTPCDFYARWRGDSSDPQASMASYGSPVHGSRLGSGAQTEPLPASASPERPRSWNVYSAHTTVSGGRGSVVSAFLMVAAVLWRDSQGVSPSRPRSRRLNTNSSTDSSEEAQVHCTGSKSPIKPLTEATRSCGQRGEACGSWQGVEVRGGQALGCAAKPRLDQRLLGLGSVIRSRCTRIAGWPSKCGAVK